MNLVSTCKVVPRIEESKHNCHLRLPCTRLQTAKLEKPKTYIRNWWIINSWTGLWLRLITSGMGEYMYHFWKTFFLTKDFYFCKPCFVLCFLVSTNFFAYLIVWSHPSTETGNSDKQLICCLDLKKNIMWADNELIVSSKDISNQWNDQQIESEITLCLVRMTVPS